MKQDAGILECWDKIEYMMLECWDAGMLE